MVNTARILLALFFALSFLKYEYIAIWAFCKGRINKSTVLELFRLACSLCIFRIA